MGPFPLQELFGSSGVYVIHLLIGFAFGYVLEISGFGDSPKLAAQFYFKDMTVIKVMFTGIIVAMVLIFLFAGLGLIDYNMLWVNPTYLWPGIVGGLIMGVGFIVGGFCPGTSLVAVATLKLDGIFFVLGVLFGIFAFGETVEYYDEFWNSSYMGRYTLMDLFNTETGWITLAVVVMAIFMFWGSEQLEKIFGKLDPKNAPKWRIGGAAVLFAIVAAIIVIGQPDVNEKWEAIAVEKQPMLDERAIQVHPGEVLTNIEDPKIVVKLIDVRPESDYNIFHLKYAENIPLDDINEWIPSFLLAESNTLYVVMSNDEGLATEAWKMMVSESIPNVYILEGGLNNWLALFTEDMEQITSIKGEEMLMYNFDIALGARHPAAYPDLHEYHFEYENKVKMELKRGPSAGGCG